MTPDDDKPKEDNDTDARNPFETPEYADEEATPPPVHGSDDPGTDEVVEPDDKSLHPSSGEHTPSPPRRPGGGTRQARRRESTGIPSAAEPVVPGEILYGNGDVTINAGAPVTTIEVVNTADRPVQIGSHYHFAEVNPGLAFDRDAAWGKRLNVLSGGAARFEPGVRLEVELIPIRGQRIVRGLRGEVKGKLDG